MFFGGDSSSGVSGDLETSTSLQPDIWQRGSTVSLYYTRLQGW